MPRQGVLLALVCVIFFAGCSQNKDSVDASLCRSYQAVSNSESQRSVETFDAANTGVQSGPAIHEQPAELWSRATGEYYSDLQMVDGLLYVVLGETPEGRKLFQINPMSGEENWSMSLGSSVNPEIAGSTIYLPHRSGNFYALDIPTDSEVWSVPLQVTVGVPVVHRETIFQLTGGTGFGATEVSANNAASGETVWTYSLPQIGDGPDRSFNGELSVGNGGVYFGSIVGRVYGVDIPTGKLCWETSAGGNGITLHAPAIADDSVFFSKDDSIVALDSQTGDQKWRHDGASSLSGIAVSPTGVIYFGTEDGSLRAIGARSGEEKWTLETGDFRKTNPVVVEEVLFAVGSDRLLYAVDTTTGTILWTYEVGESFYRPLVSDGFIFVVADQQLLALYEPDIR